MAGVLAPEQTQDIEVRLDASTRRPAGLYSAIIEIATNDPERPLVEIPVTLEVQAPPRIGFPGATIALQSSLDFTENGRTAHVFATTEPPAGPGRIVLSAQGEFGGDKTATVTAEGAGRGPDRGRRGYLRSSDRRLSAQRRRTSTPVRRQRGRSRGSQFAAGRIELRRECPRGHANLSRGA